MVPTDMVPGVAFHLFVGQRIPSAARSCCIVTGKYPALFRRNYEQWIHRKFELLMKTARCSAWLQNKIQRT